VTRDSLIPEITSTARAAFDFVSALTALEERLQNPIEIDLISTKVHLLVQRLVHSTAILLTRVTKLGSIGRIGTYRAIGA
jgi:hypothetical protein